MQSVIVALVMLVGLAVSGLAQSIYPMQQERSVAVEAEAGMIDPNSGVGSSATAPDFEPWLKSLHARHDQEWDEGFVAAAADQLSEINGTLLSAYGFGDIEAASDDNGVGPGTSRGLYHVRFAVAAPVVMQMSGALAVAVDGEYGHPWDSWNIAATASVRIRQIAGPLVFDQAVDVWGTRDEPVADESQSLAFVSELGPGVYELDVVADVTLDFAYVYTSSSDVWVLGEVSYVMDVEFLPVEGLVDCEASDIDGDTDVDLLDLYQLQHCFDGPH